MCYYAPVGRKLVNAAGNLRYSDTTDADVSPRGGFLVPTRELLSY